MPKLIKTKIKNSAYKRNGDRNKQPGNHLNQASMGLRAVSKIFVAVVLTPAIVVSELFSQAFILHCASILLAAGYLCNFAYRLYKRDISFTEASLTVLGVGLSIALAIFITPSLFSFGAIVVPFVFCALAVPSIIYQLYKSDISLIKAALLIIAVAGLVIGGIYLLPGIISYFTISAGLSILNNIADICVLMNVFFFVKELIVPPIKKAIDSIFRKIHKKTTGEDYNPLPYISTEQFSIKHDGTADDRMALNRHFKYIYNKPLLPESIDSNDGILLSDEEITKMKKPLDDTLKILNGYINKYHERLFGSILHQDQIQSLNNIINNITSEAKEVESAREFINNKIQRKQGKIGSLLIVRAELVGLVNSVQNAKDDSDELKSLLKRYNESASKYFSNHSKVKNRKEAQDNSEELSSILTLEIERQDNKKNRLLDVFKGTAKNSLKIVEKDASSINSDYMKRPTTSESPTQASSLVKCKYGLSFFTATNIADAELMPSGHKTTLSHV